MVVWTNLLIIETTATLKSRFTYEVAFFVSIFHFGRLISLFGQAAFVQVGTFLPIIGTLAIEAEEPNF